MLQNRVLIVDDDHRICRIIKRIADSLGVESLVSGDGSTFLDDFRAYQPNIILLDLQMPGVDGIEIMRRLATEDTDAAIFLISGMDKSVLETTATLGQSLGLNMAGFLRKPIEMSEAKRILAQHVEPPKPRVYSSVQVTADEFAAAIDERQLVAYFQPKLNLQTQKLIGAEVLARWQHPEHGLVFPDAFMSFAEQDEALMQRFTEYMIDCGVRHAKAWATQMPDVAYAFNLSAVSLTDLQLPENLERILKQHSFRPDQLILELTETAAMEDPARTMDILTRMRLKNFKLSIDDFGTGYSSLVQLYRLPFNEMKIDRSFVMQAMSDEEAASIVRITVELGHSLGLGVVAEGIEDQPTMDWLTSLGCDIGQGYFISRPVSADDFEAWARQHA